MVCKKEDQQPRTVATYKNKRQQKQTFPTIKEKLRRKHNLNKTKQHKKEYEVDMSKKI